MVEYPITAILGNRGSGKTCFMTFLAHEYHKKGKRIFANYHLIDIPYEYMSFSKMATLPDELNDALVLTDEMHMGADSYDFMKNSSRAFSTFATQLRKRRVHWYYTTQIMTQVAKRIRTQTDYIITMVNTKKEGVFEASVYDRHDYDELFGTPKKNFLFDGKPYFKFYDTNEVVLFDPEDSEGDFVT